MSAVDVGLVPPQGGYVARRCPMRVQNDVVRPANPRALGLVVERRFDRGLTFEATARRQIEGVGPTEPVDLGDFDPNDLGTVPDHITVLLGVPLPTDSVCRRAGTPDMLVRRPSQGFRAVDIKHHMTLDATTPEDGPPAALISSLDRPAFEDASPDPSLTARRRDDDLLQLAHYQRMLEAAGLAPPTGRWGGILGTERRIVWYDLDAPMWRGPSGVQSSMERYDAEFALRLDVIAAARAHLEDPTIPLLARPVRIGECDECPWWHYCKEQLQSGSGDISLLPRLGRREWTIHHAHGVTDRASLATLDPVAARLVASGIDIPDFQRLVEGLPDDTPITDLGAVIRAKTQLARLKDEGVATFGDLSALDPRTVSYAGSGLSSLPDQIDLARAALGPAPVYRRRGVGGLVVPRADVEVDVDMENIEEGVYLWGALLTTREGSAVTSLYRSFVTWGTLSPAVELANSSEFWGWLQDLRADAHQSERSFRAYCYNASAENTYLRRLGVGLGIMHEVTEFIESEEWVDLLRVVDDQLISGTGSGLKAVAPLTGFQWGVDDPGGGISMVQYDIAAQGDDSPERQAARDWLLTYNRGDVEATLSIRDWLESGAHSVPSIEVLTGQDFAAASASTAS